MNAPDTVIVTADQNPAFFEELKKNKPGDKGTCDLKYTVKEVGVDSAVLTVEAWVPEGYEVDEQNPNPEPPAVMGDAVMTPTAMAVKKMQSNKS